MERHRLSAYFILALAISLVFAATSQARVLHHSRSRQHVSAPKRHKKLEEMGIPATFGTLAPRATPIGLLESTLTVLTEDASAVLSEEEGSVVTALELDFPTEYSGETVEINDRQLFGKCRGNLLWLSNSEFPLTIGPRVNGVVLDAEGQAFVLLAGLERCQSGKTRLEGSLEEPPYTIVTASFTVLPPGTE